MKPALKMLLVGAAIAVATHGVTIAAAPYVLMNVAMKRISRGGERVNQWVHAPRTSEKSRTVVRPSPDLAYSSCIYDLSRGPVHVTAAAWDDYMSVSVFAANSDNVFVINDREAPRGTDLLIFKDGQAIPAGNAARKVLSPSTRGIVLERRLTPTAESFVKAAAARANDRCEQVTN